MTRQPHSTSARAEQNQPAPKSVADMPDREAQREHDHAVDDVSNPSTEKRRWLRQRRRTSTSRSLNERERDTLRHFLGLLLEADEPEAMLACLRRLAELKAHDAIRGALVDRQVAERWFRLAEALVTVERQIIASKD
jgi:hypothetical protein